MTLKNIERLLFVGGVLVLASLYAKSPGSLFEIRGVSAGPSTVSEAMTYTAPDGQAQKLFVQKRPLLDLGSVESVAVGNDAQTGQPALQVTLTPAGRMRYTEFAKQHPHQRIAIFIDGKLHGAPVLEDGQSQNVLSVREGFTPSQLSDVAARMNAAVSGK